MIPLLFFVGAFLTLLGVKKTYAYTTKRSEIPVSSLSPLPPPELNPNVARWWNKIVYYSNMFGLDPYLVASIVEIESKGDPKAKAKTSTATGLMQITYSTARAMGVDPSLLTNPDWNLYAGCKYLRYLLDRYKDVYKAVYSYYAGSYPHSKYHNAASSYASKVLSYYNSIVV